MAFCEQCNKWITQPEKTRKKRFCNNTCRHNFWYGKNKKGKVVEKDEKLESKVNYITPTPASYDRPKMIPINDEAGQWDDKPLDMERMKRELLAQTPTNPNNLVFPLSPLEAAKLMRRFWDEKFELSCPEEHEAWLEKLEASALNRKQKDLVKTTNQR